MHVRALVIVCLTIAWASWGASCGAGDEANSSLCPGYDPDVTFCESVYCDPNDGQCRVKPGPCSGPCLESEQRCVECLGDPDCTSDDAPFCDTHEHWCRGCTNDGECHDRIPWCDGGPGECNVATGRCVPGNEPPCGSSSECQNELRQCFECREDADCGEYDFCENPVECDPQSGQCVARPPRCENMASDGDGEPLICSSALQACVECEADIDCEMRAPRFCAPVAKCSTETGTCDLDGDPPLDVAVLRYCGGDGVPDADETLQVCVESRKTCQDIPCTSDEDCDDGVGPKEGGFKYCDTGSASCRRAPVDPLDPDDDGDGLPTSDDPSKGGGSGSGRGGMPRVGDACKSSEDCDDAGLVCRPPLIESADENNNTRTCNPCVSDEDCTRADDTDADVLRGEAGDAEGRSLHKCLPSGRCNWPELAASGTKDVNARFNRADSVWMQWQAGHRSQNLEDAGAASNGDVDAATHTTTSWGTTTIIVIIIISAFLIVGLVFIIISVAAFQKRSRRTKRS